MLHGLIKIPGRASVKEIDNRLVNRVAIPHFYQYATSANSDQSALDTGYNAGIPDLTTWRGGDCRLFSWTG